MHTHHLCPAPCLSYANRFTIPDANDIDQLNDESNNASDEGILRAG